MVKYESVFSETWDEDDTKKTIRAPSKKYFEITNVLISCNAVIDGYMILTSEPLEDLDYIPQKASAIAHCTMNQKQTQNFQFLNGFKTKFLTVGFSNSGSYQAKITVVYRIVPATKPDLIFDFIKKYR